MSDIILASESPRRQELLRLLGLPFTVEPSDFDESTVAQWPPEEHVIQSATGKVQDVAVRFPNGIIIGADTIVVIDDQILGKPSSQDDAVRMLKLLSGRSHYVYTGLCVLQQAKVKKQDYVKTEVKFGQLTDEIIRAYVATGEPLDKAGAYGIQERGCVFVEGIVGDYFNIVGLPIYRLSRMLADVGIPLFGE